MSNSYNNDTVFEVLSIDDLTFMQEFAALTSGEEAAVMPAEGDE